MNAEAVPPIDKRYVGSIPLPSGFALETDVDGNPVEISRGNLSVVYKGYECESHNPVVIKVLDKDHYDRDIADFLTSEIKCLQRLKDTSDGNTGVPHPLLLGTVDNNYFSTLVLEYIPGMCLLDYLMAEYARIYKADNRPELFLATYHSKERISLIKDIFVKTVKAYLYCMKRGVFHRDIKPENLMLYNIKGHDNAVSSADVKIIDFGLSLLTADANLTDKEIDKVSSCHGYGSLPYAAPELLYQNFCYNPTKSDAFSLGCVLYGMIYGDFPIPMHDNETPNTYKAKKKQNNIQYEALSFEDFPLFLDLLQSLLHKNISKRRDVRDILSHPWFSQ